MAQGRLTERARREQGEAPNRTPRHMVIGWGNTIRETRIRLDKVVAVDQRKHALPEGGSKYFLYLEGGHKLDVDKEVYDEVGRYLDSLFFGEKEDSTWRGVD